MCPYVELWPPSWAIRSIRVIVTPSVEEAYSGYLLSMHESRRLRYDDHTKTASSKYGECLDPQAKLRKPSSGWLSYLNRRDSRSIKPHAH